MFFQEKIKKKGKKKQILLRLKQISHRNQQINVLNGSNQTIDFKSIYNNDLLREIYIKTVLLSKNVIIIFFCKQHDTRNTVFFKNHLSENRSYKYMRTDPIDFSREPPLPPDFSSCSYIVRRRSSFEGATEKEDGYSQWSSVSSIYLLVE